MDRKYLTMGNTGLWKTHDVVWRANEPLSRDTALGSCAPEGCLQWEMRIFTHRCLIHSMPQVCGRVQAAAPGQSSNEIRILQSDSLPTTIRHPRTKLCHSILPGQSTLATVMIDRWARKAAQACNAALNRQGTDACATCLHLDRNTSKPGIQAHM